MDVQDGTKYQGFIIFTAQRLFVFSVFDIPYNRSMTLAKLIASVIKRLSDNKTTVVSVCTDNAKYNVSALNGNKNSAQQLSGEYFIRQTCATPTANLVLKDLFHPKDKSNINNENLHC